MLNIYNNRNSNSLLIYMYYIIYALFVFFTIFVDSQINVTIYSKLVNPVYDFIEILFLFVNIIAIFMSKNRFKILLSILLIILTIVPIVFFGSQIISLFFLLIYLMIVNSSNWCKSLNLLKISILADVSAIVSIVFLSKINFFPNYIALRGTNVQRYSFGFNSPNTPGLMIGSLIMLLILLLYYSVHFKILYILIGSLFVISFIILQFTDSMESLVLLIVLLILFVFKDIKFLKNLLPKFLIYIYIITVSISIYFTFLCNPYSTLFLNVDKFTTNRLSEAVMAFHIYPLRLTGYKNLSLLSEYHSSIVGIIDNPLEFSAAGLDNGYMANIMKLGIIGFIILSIFIIFSLRYIKNTKNYLSSLCLSAVFISLLAAQCNIFYIFIPLCIVIGNNILNNKVIKNGHI